MKRRELQSKEMCGLSGLAAWGVRWCGHCLRQPRQGRLCRGEHGLTCFFPYPLVGLLYPLCMRSDHKHAA